jgi:hypothetical protein
MQKIGDRKSSLRCFRYRFRYYFIFSLFHYLIPSSVNANHYPFISNEAI